MTSYRQLFTQIYFDGELNAGNLRCRYAAVFYKCPAFNDNAPFALSLTANCSDNATNLLYIDVPQTNVEAAGSTIDVKLQAGEMKVLHTVCFSVLQSNYSNYKRLIETLEINRMFGAQRFVFYNLSSTREIQLVLESYERNGIAEVIQWTSLPVTEVHYYGQLAALNDCMYRNLYRSTFVLFADLDEIVVPRDNLSISDDDWTNMFEYATRDWLSAGNGVDQFPGAYMLRNVFFWTNNRKLFGNFSGFEDWLSRSEAPTIESQMTVLRETYIWPYNARSKYFVWSKAAVMIGIHFPYKMIADSVKTVHVNETIGLLQHYRTMDGDYAEPSAVVDTWMERYGSDIVCRVIERRRAVLNILRETNRK